MEASTTYIVRVDGQRVLSKHQVKFDPNETVGDLHTRLLKEGVVDESDYLIFAGRNLFPAQCLGSLKLSQWSFIMASQTPGLTHPDEAYPLPDKLVHKNCQRRQLS